MLFYDSIYISLLLYLLFESIHIVTKTFTKCEKSVIVIVLGDIGRSPRMQYHAISLSRCNFKTYLLGYKESRIHPTISQEKNVQIRALCIPPRIIYLLPKLVVYIIKVLWQTIDLFYKLVYLPKTSHILLQNPPSIPTIFICLFICKIQNTKFIVDWHNFGYSILALSLNTKHPLVEFSRWYERFFGQFADSHFCVTKAMKTFLKQQWNIEAIVLYDRPFEDFKKTSINDTHKLFNKLSNSYKMLTQTENQHIFTEICSDNTICLKTERPVLLVSSTSWTVDEDFYTLFKALKDYDANAKENSLPKIICIVTGKGPDKAKYECLISQSKFNYVKWCFPWLEPEDYPLLIGSADLGVCLHISSSNLDLPMKVIDMFGCEVPVLAVHYDCINELVKHNKNGLIFKDSNELYKQLKELLNGFPNSCEKIKQYQHELKHFGKWETNWMEIALPKFQS